MTDDRFWSKVDRRSPGECWPWTAKARTVYGYGVFRLSADEGVGLAHRLAWSSANGVIPAGMVVRHTCDNPICCNPAHLELGTHWDNAQDRKLRGRVKFGHLPGEKNGRAILTEQTVREIRSSSEPLRVLAQRFGVSKAQVSSVRSGRAWRSVA